MNQQIDLQLSNDGINRSIFNNKQQSNSFVYQQNKQKLTFQDMLQPITTQTKFNQVKKKQSRNSQNYSQQRQNQPKYNQSISTPKHLEDQQTRKFRQYLNEKVNQLKKSQQIQKNRTNQKQSNQKRQTFNSNNKINQLRKIINNQQIKNNKIQKVKSIKQQNKQQNGIIRTIQPNQTAKSTQKQNQNTKKSEQKKFSNSHSNLKVDDKNKNQLKRSVQMTSKTPKLPLLKLPNIPNDKKDNSQKLIHVSQKLTKNNIKEEQQLNQKAVSVKKVADTSNNFRIKKGSSNILIDQKNVRQQQKNNNDKDKQKNKGNQSPIMTSKNKKMREDFVRLNQQERILQMEIFKQHNQTKKTLEKMMKKYQLSSEQYQKYGIKRQIVRIDNQQNVTQSKVNESMSKIPSKKNISEGKSDSKRNESPLKRQQNINASIDEQIHKIDNLLKLKQKQLKRLQSKIQKNAYIQFIKQMPEDIMQLNQQQQPQQEDQVKQLPSNIPLDGQTQMIGFGKTYSQVMNEMRKKKWGLNQRITFETHRENIQKGQQNKVRDHKFPINNSEIQNDKNINQQIENSNKIAVNSKLKNLLFD